MPLSPRKSSLFTSNNPAQMPLKPNAKDYSRSGYGILRHDYTSAVLGSGSIASNSYAPIPLLKFKRTFSGVSDDVPPTPTAGNNYQTPEVFNGSRIENFEAVVHIRNTGANTNGYWLTVYEGVWSFFDAYLHNSIYPSQCPVTFDSTGTAPDTRGQVDLKTPTATLISTNLNKSLKFLQHYIKPVGKLWIPPKTTEQSGIDLKINKVPAKARRANSGMYWGIFLHNDSTDNDSAAALTLLDVEVKFDEIPSEFRLPYLS